VLGNVRNLILFKLGWVACVMLAAAGNPVLAALAVGVVVAAHLFTVPVAIKEALLLLVAALIGLAWESLLVGTGLVRYPAGVANGGLAPYWIVAMWVLFATTINHGLQWTKRSLPVASAAGLVGGPLAFYGGAGLGAVEFSDPLLALAVIGAGWAVLLPLLTVVADAIIDGDRPEPGADQPRGPTAVGAEPAPVPAYDRTTR